MQVILLLASILVIVASAKSAAIDVPATILTLNDLSQSDRDYLEYLENEAIRQKRSGDILGAVKSKISEGIKSKLSGIASASSHASSFISGGSKSFHNYATHDDKNFNFWDLQKSIFHTLLQAAKAIKGGLLAIKGQIIKGSGYVISAKGKLITSKGEAIKNIGKHIASSAILIPRANAHQSAPSGPPEHGYAEAHPSGGYGGPSGPNVEYHTHHYEHIPSAIGDHKFPPTYEAYKDHLPRASNQGILVIKKIPKVKKEELKGNTSALITHETHEPDIETEEPINPPFTFIPETNPSSYSNDYKDALPPSYSPTTYEQLPTYDSQPPQYEVPSSAGFVQNLPPQHVYTSPSAQSNVLTKLETYNPLSLPNGIRQPLSMGIPNYNIQKYPTNVYGLEHYPTYPLDLHKSFNTGAQYSTLTSDAFLSPPSKHQLNTKLNSRLKRLPNNKSFKSVANRLKPKNF